ncbi:hypothetical protein [Alteromonas gilva]|uniref:Uncharacterized protein n=1 Tax=Alteromonas gilva TaxID=2987522 RepID=A0ABT5L726_9ALTE|nr:hypothetical protein [Alteromonas gilva]MDC8832831.1 hypothetical protein [Alteromonas gilva]
MTDNTDITFEQANPIADHFSNDHCSEETANEARAGSGWNALMAYASKAYGNVDPEPVEQGIRDLLGDLQHLCNSLGLDFDYLLERATGTFRDELESPLG